MCCRARRQRLSQSLSGGELVGRELHVDRHHVPSRRRQRRILQRRERDVEIGFGRDLAVLRRVERALEIVDARADVDPAVESGRVADAAKNRQRRSARDSFLRPCPGSGSCGSWSVKPGSSSTGSTRSRKVRRGSAFETTADAGISVPSSSTTPVTRPSRTRTRLTAGAGADLRARASRARSPSRASAPRAPLDRHAAAAGSRIDRRVEEEHGPVPADQGPCAVPKMPRAAMARLQQVGLEPLRDEIGRPPSDPSAAADSRPSVRARGSGAPAFSRSHSSPVARRAQRRRRDFQQPGQERRQGAPSSRRNPGSDRRLSARTREWLRRCAP